MPGDEDPGWAGTPHYQEHQVQDSLNWNNLAVALVGVLCPVIERGGGHAAGVVVFQPPAPSGSAGPVRGSRRSGSR